MVAMRLLLVGTQESDPCPAGKKISHELHEWIPEFVKTNFSCPLYSKSLGDTPGARRVLVLDE
jgi:hypothetical protein